MDLPPEESEELVESCQEVDLKNIFIIAPTTPEARIPKIVKKLRDFYYVSREGVTGTRDDLASDLESRVLSIKNHTALPVVAGFGISTPEHVKKWRIVRMEWLLGVLCQNCISSNLQNRKNQSRNRRESTPSDYWFVLGEAIDAVYWRVCGERRKARDICSAGVTAAGKSDFAIKWAEENDAEILSCDSVAIYRGMDLVPPSLTWK